MTDLIEERNQVPHVIHDKLTIFIIEDFVYHVRLTSFTINFYFDTTKLEQAIIVKHICF